MKKTGIGWVQKALRMVGFWKIEYRWNVWDPYFSYKYKIFLKEFYSTCCSVMVWYCEDIRPCAEDNSLEVSQCIVCGENTAVCCKQNTTMCSRCSIGYCQECWSVKLVSDFLRPLGFTRCWNWVFQPLSVRKIDVLFWKFNMTPKSSMESQRNRLIKKHTSCECFQNYQVLLD